ncbi:hypothetical protein ACHAPT_006709 [Fusarium lateritium]
MGLETDFFAYDRFMEQAWPEPEVYKAYRKWARKWLGRHMDRISYRIPDEDFFQQLRNTNLTKKGDLAQLCWTLNMCNVPLVLLGEADFDGTFTGYAIRPSSNFLDPSPPLEPMENREDLMHESALAIDLNVHTDDEGFPSSRVRELKKELVTKQGNKVPDSVDINPDGPDGKTNFVFVQLGELCVCVDDWKTARAESHDDIVGGTWRLTGFGVVAEVTAEGAPKALWAIYNTQLPTEPLTDEINRVHEAGGGSTWGWIFKKHPDGDARDIRNKFFAARITENLDNFGPTKPLKVEIFSRNEGQIVRSMVYEPSPGNPAVVPVQVLDSNP